MSHHGHEAPAVNHLAISDEDYKHHKSDIVKTTIILSAITIIEVGFAMAYTSLFPNASLMILRIGLVVMSLLKAAYIMLVFMHVKHEKTAMMLTIFLPFTLLIWMIIAFMSDGSAVEAARHLRFPH